jgi:plastocyanin
MDMKLPIIVVAILVILIVGGYVLNQNRAGVASLVATSTVESLQEEDSDSSINTENTKEEDKPTDEVSDVTKVNTEGMHIMADGKVMTKDGKEVTDAMILANGTIKLSDGTIVTPAFDLRSTTPSEINAPKHVVMDIAGVDFAYDIKQIKVKKGDTVTINFKSNEGFHDWVVDEFNAATERVSEKDGITSVTFVADTVGTFQYYCSVMNHRQMGMIGYLIVEEK